MTSFADPLALLLVLLLPVDDAAPEWARSAAGEVARERGVSPDRVCLEGGDALPSGVLVRLSPGGRDGWRTVVVRTEAGAKAPFRIRAGVRDSVWVAARALAPGDTLASSDIRLASEVVWGKSPGDWSPQIGSTVRRSLREGQTLYPVQLAAPLWVSAGDAVALTWDRGGVRIALEGTALHGARRGETVRVKVAGRTGVFTGVVVAPGQADIKER